MYSFSASVSDKLVFTSSSETNEGNGTVHLDRRFPKDEEGFKNLKDYLLVTVLPKLESN